MDKPDVLVIATSITAATTYCTPALPSCPRASVRGPAGTAALRAARSGPVLLPVPV